MNYLAAIGIETWRNTRALPGAKIEIAADCYEFFDEQKIAFRVVCPKNINQAAKLLVNNFCKAIELVFHYRSEVKLFQSVQNFSASPIFILGKTLGEMIQESQPTFSAESFSLIIGEGPETVMTTPLLKATWWKLITTMINGRPTGCS